MRSLPVTLIHVVAASPANSLMGADGTTTQRQEDQARQIVEQARRIVGELGGQKPAGVHTARHGGNQNAHQDGHFTGDGTAELRRPSWWDRSAAAPVDRVGEVQR